MEDASRATLKLRWRRRGLNAFDADADAIANAGIGRGPARESNQSMENGDGRKVGDRE